MRPSRLFFSFALALATAASAGGFEPGNVFVAAGAVHFCTKQHFPGGTDRIWEIDPRTGEVTLFVELTGDDCSGIQGLTFTPDGQFLQTAGYAQPGILQFDSSGNMSVVLDRTDGVKSTLGGNALAYDARGDLYVATNEFERTILRFPQGAAPATTFADRQDGVGGPGVLAFAADGDLYFASLGFAIHVLRIAPSGAATVFDEFGSANPAFAAAADVFGTVFLGTSDRKYYSYEAGNPGSQQLFVQLPLGWGESSMAICPSQRRIFVVSAEYPGEETSLYAIDTLDASVSTLAGWDTSTYYSGIAVVPALSGSGDFDSSGAPGLLDLIPAGACLQGPLAVPVPLGCRPADFDTDLDVDLADFAAFQVAFTGS